LKVEKDSSNFLAAELDEAKEKATPPCGDEGIPCCNT